MKHIKSYNKFINEKNNKTLFVIDVQKSFSKFFTSNYIDKLSKYCKKFTEVYQIFDNHHVGKNPDKDFLYDNSPDIEDKSDLYAFPNQIDQIEKRYVYNVNIDYYKNILDEKTYSKIKSNEKNLKIGDYFETTAGSIIVYIGNNHRYFHCPLKLYKLFLKLKGKDVMMVGGAENECIYDIQVTAKTLGVDVFINNDYIYSATNCPK